MVLLRYLPPAPEPRSNVGSPHSNNALTRKQRLVSVCHQLLRDLTQRMEVLYVFVFLTCVAWDNISLSGKAMVK